MPGTRAVAVPVLTDGGVALGPITVTAMVERLGVERFGMVVERMMAAAGGRVEGK
jgi:DNA-binding IclR family transcriptional regulator